MAIYHILSVESSVTFNIFFTFKIFLQSTIRSQFVCTWYLNSSASTSAFWKYCPNSSSKSNISDVHSPFRDSQFLKCLCEVWNLSNLPQHGHLFSYSYQVIISMNTLLPCTLQGVFARAKVKQQLSASEWVCPWILVSFCIWCLGGELTWLDTDPCYSLFGYRQVGLRGHTSAPRRSQLSFPHSEQSASEHLEYQPEHRNSFCDWAHAQTWLEAASL